MRATAKEVAEKSQEEGLGTHGDLRNADAAFFREECDMGRFGAIALVQMLERAPREQDGGSATSGTVTEPAGGLAGGS